jgi:hypothetical protein
MAVPSCETGCARPPVAPAGKNLLLAGTRPGAARPANHWATPDLKPRHGAARGSFWRPRVDLAIRPFPEQAGRQTRCARVTNGSTPCLSPCSCVSDFFSACMSASSPACSPFRSRPAPSHPFAAWPASSREREAQPLSIGRIRPCNAITCRVSSLLRRPSRTPCGCRGDGDVVHRRGVSVVSDRLDPRIASRALRRSRG